MDNISVVEWDARISDTASKESADIVLADLPCSGLGIIGRKPDIKYHTDIEKIEQLASLQREILTVVQEYVKPGGTLVYSTCTISRSENEENAAWFEKNFPFIRDGSAKQLLPGIDGTDGFFMVKFRKKLKIPAERRRSVNNDSLELIDIKSMDEAQLQAYFEQLGEKKFRASQVYQWLHQKLVTDFEQMTNLPESLRKTLKENCRLTALTAERVQVSQIDGTSKYLFKLYDGNLIESVLMKYHHGNSVCISSQVGCRMGCRFCASTLDGMVRNLAPSEMLDQIYRIQTISGERVDNIVIMGSGEPMDNFQNVVQFLKLINSDKGLHISARNITVSTCGLVDKIRDLQTCSYRLRCNLPSCTE